MEPPFQNDSHTQGNINSGNIKIRPNGSINCTFTFPVLKGRAGHRGPGLCTVTLSYPASCSSQHTPPWLCISYKCLPHRRHQASVSEHIPVLGAIRSPRMSHLQQSSTIHRNPAHKQQEVPDQNPTDEHTKTQVCLQKRRHTNKLQWNTHTRDRCCGTVRQDTAYKASA